MGKTRETNKYYRKVNRGPYSRGSSARGRSSYYSPRGYSRNNGRYFSNKYWERTHTSKPRSRPLSPVEGSEEFMARKIELTSAIIMRQLLSPNEPIASSSKLLSKDMDNDGITIIENIKPKEHKEKSPSKTRKISPNEINVKEIHEKIMNRITNLNDGRKKNFINAHNNTSLDSAIQHIHKQKRLELSRVLRDMCSSSHSLQKSGELINSIIPDIGIKIEELPIDVIQELRQTLNLDLDEDILDPVIPANNSHMTISSDELNAAIDSIQVKTEQVDTLCCSGSVEIKLEDIVDCCGLGDNTQSNVEEIESSVMEKTILEETERDKRDTIDPIHYSVTVKEESMETNENHSVATNFSDSTIMFPYSCNEHNEPEKVSKNETVREDIFDHYEELDIHDTGKIDSSNNQNYDNEPNIEHLENAASQTDKSNESLENVITQFVANDELDLDDISEVSERLDLVDKCLKCLSGYRELLVKSVINHCYKKQGVNKNREGIGIPKNISSNNVGRFVDQSSQTVESVVATEAKDKRVTKRRKVENSTQENKNKIEVKTEPIDNEEQDILTFPKLQDRVMVIEKVDNQLVLATESGNIIYVSLKDGTFLHTLDVTTSPITSVVFIKRINEFIHMYVGCLDHALRIYDFKSRKMIKGIHLDDHIRCMDVKWDYVFMGCSGGTLFRYSTKTGKIEFEEKNTGTDILVLKAAQEGPRRVLIVGHKRAPIYVRDAMSGLYLRNFSNEAITPTVYALITNNNNLYCGTAQNNILVFSFHEGHLLHKLVAEDCKGISCMIIYNDLLFSGCYNGSIYVYNLKTKQLLTTLKGPGGSISCMEVLNNQVIVGTLTGQLGSVVIPEEVYLNS